MNNGLPRGAQRRASISWCAVTARGETAGLRIVTIEALAGGLPVVPT